MAKLPRPPEIGNLRARRTDVKTIPAGTTLARIYFTAGAHPARWDEFRAYGPANGRFDHHLTDSEGASRIQDRAVLYCAASILTCVAEVFQKPRRIDRIRDAPWLVVFELERDLRLIDLTGALPTRIGASMAINSGSRVRAREWARRLYDAFDDLHGMWYASSMHANQPAIALNERARGALPGFPSFNRALADDTLLNPLKFAAIELGYGLR